MNDFNPYQSPQAIASPVQQPQWQISRAVWLVMASMGAAIGSFALFVASALLMQSEPTWTPYASRLGGIGLMGLAAMLLILGAVEEARRRGWK